MAVRAERERGLNFLKVAISNNYVQSELIIIHKNKPFLVNKLLHLRQNLFGNCENQIFSFAI